MALPNLRRLFVEARTEAEENEYSRNAVSHAMPTAPGTNAWLGPFDFVSSRLPDSSSFFFVFVVDSNVQET